MGAIGGVTSLEPFEDVMVIQVLPIPSTVGDGKRRRSGKKKKTGNVAEKRWGRGRRFEGRVTAQSHRRVTIPPLPECYNFMAMNNRYFSTPVEPQKVVSEEEQEANLQASLRKEVIFEVKSVIVPKKGKLPAAAKLVDISENGRALIMLKDKINSKLFSQLEDDINLWFGQKKLYKWDNRIPKEDLVIGRIVLASVPQDHGRNWNIRAKVVGFNDEDVTVMGVDHQITVRLPYDLVFYQHKNLNYAPFQIQEVHLAGLEKIEGNAVLQNVASSLIKGMNLRQCKTAWKAAKAGGHPDSFKSWAKKEGGNYDIRNFNFMLKRIVKIEGDYPTVELDFPKEVAEGVSVNEMMIEFINRFDPLKDYIVTQ